MLISYMPVILIQPSLVLHPGLKLEYFRQQQWPEDWIDTAENIVRKEYIDKYEKPMKVPKSAAPDKTVCIGLRCLRPDLMYI
jgi:hypothetical protein